MARFMLFSKLRSSIFSGVYARSNPALNTLQPCRSRSNHSIYDNTQAPLFSRHAHTTTPSTPVEPGTKIHIVWIEIKSAERAQNAMWWKNTLGEISEEIHRDVVSVVVH